MLPSQQLLSKIRGDPLSMARLDTHTCCTANVIQGPTAGTPHNWQAKTNITTNRSINAKTRAQSERVNVHLYSFFQLDDSWRGWSNVTSRSLYPQQTDPKTTVQEVGWAPTADLHRSGKYLTHHPPKGWIGGPSRP